MGLFVSLGFFLYVKIVDYKTFYSVHRVTGLAKFLELQMGLYLDCWAMKDPKSSVFSAKAAPCIAGLHGLQLIPCLGGTSLRLWYKGALVAQVSAVKPQIANVVWVSTPSLVLEPGLKSYRLHCCRPKTRNQKTVE